MLRRWASGPAARLSAFMKHISTWLVVFALLTLGRAEAAMTKAGHVDLELVPAAASISPGGTIYVALHEKIRPGLRQ